MNGNPALSRMLASHKFCHSADQADLVICCNSLFPSAVLISHWKYQAPLGRKAFSAHFAPSTVETSPELGILNSISIQISDNYTFDMLCAFTKLNGTDDFQLLRYYLNIFPKPQQRICCVYGKISFINKLLKCICEFPAIFGFLFI